MQRRSLCGVSSHSKRFLLKIVLQNAIAVNHPSFRLLTHDRLVTALYRCHYGEDPQPVGKRFMEPERLRTKQGRLMILHRDLKPENGS
jgi:hypothetical protein